MPMVKCYDCGAKVSTSAAACPKCGATAKVPVSQQIGLTLFAISMLAIVFFWWFFWSKP
jgi:uncharacterized OB-fold protein